MPLRTIILAAGQGTRMRSALPKVLHPLAGRPLLRHVVDTARSLEPASIHIVYGHGGQQVRAAFDGDGLDWVLQAEQHGTGHAVQLALPRCAPDDLVLVLYGDVPLVRAESLQSLVEAAAGGPAILTTRLVDPTGYGRIVRDVSGQVTAIVEEADASTAQRAIDEVNTGLMACQAGPLGAWLDRIGSDNAQGEIYLTDVIGLAVADGTGVGAVSAPAEEVAGINDKVQLAEAERHLRRRHARELLNAGVTLADPERVDIRGRLTCGRDVQIDVDVIFEGEVELGDEVRIGPFTWIRDARIGAGTQIQSHTSLDSVELGERCEIGPYARLRPGVEADAGAKVGNFVEVKKSRIGAGSKVSHLSYVGDAQIGERVNVGAGTITCNYDGANKHRTVIGDDAFIGSGVELVAPVEIGSGATIGAGSTVSKGAPAGELTVARARQVTVSGWRRPQKPKNRD